MPITVLFTWVVLIIVVGLYGIMALEIKRGPSPMKTAGFFLLSAVLGLLSVEVMPALTRKMGLEMGLFSVLSQVGCMLLSGAIMGFLSPARAWRWGVGMIAFFPIIAIYEGLTVRGTHQLFPFELLFYVIATAPGIVGAFVGSAINRIWGYRQYEVISLRAILLFSSISLILYFLVHLYRGRGQRIPHEEIKEAGIIRGKNLLVKKIFVEDSRLGWVEDIKRGDLDGKPGIEVVVAGSWPGKNLKGAWVLSETGEKMSFISFEGKPVDLKIIDIDKDGSCEFLSGGSRRAVLYGHSGKIMWSHNFERGIHDITSGDLDGDGKEEIVVGSGGVQLLDGKGGLIWRVEDRNVWRVAILDVDGDKKPEIAHSNAGGLLRVRDKKEGKILYETKPAVYFSNFSVCRWPTANSDQYFAIAGKKKEREEIVYLLDLKGREYRRFHVPKAFSVLNTKATPVFLSANKQPYFAILTELRASWHRSILYLFDANENLIYQEILPERCQSIAALPASQPRVEKLLVGGEGKVWQYELVEK